MLLVNNTQEHSLVDLNTFMKRFEDVFSYEFDWSNVLVAGGIISGLVDGSYDEKTYENSDIDIFVYGSTVNELHSNMERVYDDLVEQLYNEGGTIYSFVYNHTNIVTILSTSYNRPIQLIGYYTDDPHNILNNFDMSHLQIGYNGSNLLMTSAFVNAIECGVSHIMKNSIYAYRFAKAYKRGYGLSKNEGPLYIQNSENRDSYNNDHNKCFCSDNAHQSDIDSHKYGSTFSGQHDDIITNDIDMDKLLNDKHVNFLLAERYKPCVGKSPKEVVKNIRKYFSINITMIYEGEELSKYLNQRILNLF